MATDSYGDDSSQSATNYVNEKGIHELFEVEFSRYESYEFILLFLFQAMMTALMVQKPDDHITFIRECLDKVEFYFFRLNFLIQLILNSRRKIIQIIFVGIFL